MVQHRARATASRCTPDHHLLNAVKTLTLVVIVTLLLWCPLGAAQSSGAGSVSGFVVEAETGEPLPGAAVTLAGRAGGVVTNAYGFFAFAEAASDTTSLTVRYLGYSPQTLPVSELILADGGFPRIEMTPQALGGVEVTVRGDRTRRLSSGTAAISIRDAERLPALLGEIDPVRVQQLLPGVSGGVEGSSGLHVRGGSPDQTLLLLDGATVYNASHLFGFFSTFNPAAVKSVELLRGGIPARYGGRLASILDVQTREGGGGRTSGEVSVGIASAHARVEGPLGRQDTTVSARPRAAYALALRQTYAGLLARPFQSADEGASYGFGDLNGKVSFSPSRRDRIYVSAYGGSDAFTSRSRSPVSEESGRLSWGNATASVRWTRPAGRRTFIEASAVASRFGLGVESESRSLPDRETSRSSYRSGLSDVGINVKSETVGLSRAVRAVRFGGGAMRHDYRPGEASTIEVDEAEFVTGSERLGAWEGVGYAELDLLPAPALLLSVGVRLSAFSSDGVSAATLGSVEPRLAAELSATERLTVTGSLGLGTQYVHLLANSGLGLPTDLWLPSTDKVTPERGQSAALGAVLDLGLTDVSVEGYARSMRGLVEYRDGAGFFNTAGGDWESQVEQGRGRAYGLEVLVRREVGSTTGWVAYTLARSERQFDRLNDAAWFPYRYDRTHDAAAVVMHRIGRTDLSATWTYATGNALTLPLGRGPAFEIAPGGGFETDPSDDETEVYSARGAFRAPAAHRLDVSATFNRRLKGTDRALTLGLYNAYNRANPLYLALRREYEFVLVDTEDGSEQYAPVPAGARLYKFGFLPTLPAVSYRIRF